MNDSPKKNYRICIVSEQLAGGGAEKASALLSTYFDAKNCLVHHVIVIDKVEYEFRGQLLNLGKLKKNYFNWNDRIKRFWVLRQFFRQNQFDFIIDTRVRNRQWQEFWITKFIYNAPLIVVVHSFMTHLYFPKNHFLASTIFKSSYKIVAVSEAIGQKVTQLYPYKNVQTIYNPIDFLAIENGLKATISLDFQYILGVGRMKDNIKQFDKLIQCYAQSNLPSQNVKLVLIGDGPFKPKLELLAKQLILTDYVVFMGTVANPFPYYAKALFTVLTSKNEGFPTVLLESLACRTPVVAFDCQSGPSEIIKNRENGLLVENQNQQKMIQALNEMFENNALYLHCKENAAASVAKFSLDNIGQQWMKLLQFDNS